MTRSTDLSCILIAIAYIFAFLTIRRLNDPDRRRFRWQYASGLVLDGGIAVLFALLAALYAHALPSVVGACRDRRVAGNVVLPHATSRHASEESRAGVEDIMNGKHDRGGL